MIAGAFVAGEHWSLYSTPAGGIDRRMLAVRGAKPGPTTSGCARLVELNDLEVAELAAGDVLVVRFGYGLGPVVVDRVRTGIAGEGDQQFEVPVVDARIVDTMFCRMGMPDGQQLAFAPEELCRVHEARA